MRLVLTAPTPEDGGEIAEHLELLGHELHVVPLSAAAAAGVEAEACVVDARRELTQARRVCGDLETLAPELPVLAVFRVAGLSALSARWAAHEVVLSTATPAEWEARLRLAASRTGPERTGTADESLVVDTTAFTARLHGRPLNLTFKEFELLAHLSRNPGRVCSRDQLLREVWGYDYFGGTRTVDVHVRRLRAKLGPDNEHLITTVRNVGYRFDPRPAGAD